MQKPIEHWTKVDDKSIARLKHEAIDRVFLKGDYKRPRSPYQEHASRYMITLKGEKKQRRVYVYVLGNTAVQYIKATVHGVHKQVFCETALDEALNRAIDD